MELVPLAPPFWYPFSPPPTYNRSPRRTWYREDYLFPPPSPKLECVITGTYSEDCARANSPYIVVYNDRLNEDAELWAKISGYPPNPQILFSIGGPVVTISPERLAKLHDVIGETTVKIRRTA
jgi:hypothetical protein